MMKVKIRTFAQFREIFGGDLELELPEGAKLADILDIFRSGPAVQRDCLFGDDGELKRHIIVMVNRRRIRRDETRDVHLAEDDEVALFPPVAGG